MTVGRLREAIEGLPDDALVLYERIEDSYFGDDRDATGWNLVEKPDEYGDSSYYILAFTPVRYRDDDNLYITAHF